MGNPALWITFNILVVIMLAVDLFVFNRKAHRISLRESAIWSAVWVALSLAFNYWILRTHGSTPALEFFTGYVIEKSLSMDNIFVFVLVFRAFCIEPRFQHRVLFWGVFGALVMRGLMIAVGAALVQRFEWILYVFGAFLLVVGIRMLVTDEKDLHPERNPVLRWARRIFPVAPMPEQPHFLVRLNGRLAITPLFLTLVVIETTDLLFAVDSVPAVFGITRDPFLVYSSNICAILGLRAFYFLLAGVLPMFRYLDAGVSSVLIFVGIKMLAEPWLHITPYVSLLIIGGLLSAAVVASILAARFARPTDV